MSAVRGTSKARHEKKIIIREGAFDGERIFCAWEDCDNDAVFSYRVRVNYGYEDQRQTQRNDTWYAFCCERHRQYFINSHRDHKNLPEGYRGML